ncbi:MAG: type II toxin-antitoxin system VapC family toxin [Acidobacteriia bacterium]|nr:type II toxin-antitoxin system VapC family toxin [Terriglobia bacterium]
MSGFLLDTNIIAELIKPRPEPRVVAWVDATDENLLYLSVLTLGEIRKGIVGLPHAARQAELEAWLESDLRLRFAGRILTVDEAVAERWGIIAGNAAMRGAVMPVIDGLLAATAIHNNLTLVTRNTGDVAETGVLVFNPWEG